MGEHASADPPVMSWASYLIAAVMQREPTALADFLCRGAIDVDALDAVGRPVRIVGTTRPRGCLVVLAEGREGDGGERTWLIDQEGSAFYIATRAVL